MPVKVIMVGRVFGKRKVIGRAQKKWGVKPFWHVQCECGAEDDVLGAALRQGKANQCRRCRAKEFGIRSTTHGQARVGKISSEFRIWSGMKDRCTNPHSEHWRLYGGRGIKVCERWMTDFSAFFVDMGARPSAKHSLDRFPNNDGNYEPSNCRWATQKEQIHNQRKHGLIEIFTNDELKAELHRRGLNGT